METKLLTLKEKGAKRMSTHINMPLKLNYETDDYHFEKYSTTHLSRLQENFYLKTSQDERKLRKLKYKLKIALFSNFGLFEDSSNSDVGYHFVMKSTSPKESNIYLATTLSEKKHIIGELTSKGKEFITIRL